MTVEEAKPTNNYLPTICCESVQKTGPFLFMAFIMAMSSLSVEFVAFVPIILSILGDFPSFLGVPKMKQIHLLVINPLLMGRL